MSELSITTASDTPDPSSSPEEGSFVVEIEAPPAARPIDTLRSKLAKARSALYRDLEVPRWPQMSGMRAFVRFAPLDPTMSQKITDEFQKTKADDWSVQAAAQKLVHCCQGIYVTDLGDTEHKYSLRPDDPEGTWTKFDADLAVTLSLIDSSEEYQRTSAIATCRAFYLTEGDLFTALVELNDWSGLTSDEAERDFPTP